MHSAVYPLVVNAYGRLRDTQPAHHFVYGETGFVGGGRFRPHRTHQNGLSVDFMVPVRGPRGQSLTFPTPVELQFGYGLKFDALGKGHGLTVDFEAIAAHLLALKQESQAQGIPITRVIFAPDLQLQLKRTTLWSQIRDLPFSRKKSWVRHDDHYHVDFDVRCKPTASSG